MLTRRTSFEHHRPLSDGGGAGLFDSCPNGAADPQRIEIVPLGGFFDVEARPFRHAVASHPAANGAGRALDVWKRFVVGLLDVVSEPWTHGISRDLYDGDLRMLVEPVSPYVEVVSDAPAVVPDPMQLRGVVHLAESMRSTMRREAAVSTSELDTVIDCVVADAIVRFPVEHCVDPARAALSLGRLGAGRQGRRRSAR
ncbi:MAG: hypothetical protein AAGF73_10350 [Actinomycetota bacterium]